jgi:hypothetical protein
MMVGIKNSGKSTLCKYFLNRCFSLHKDVCLLDCDPGKGFHLPATVSLTCYDSVGKIVDSVCYWTGEHSPLNYTQLYLSSIDKLVRYHRENYFGSALVINTMGYLTGLGEIILYELFNIVQPTNTLLLSNQKNDGQLESIALHLASGNYTERLHLFNKDTLKEPCSFLKVLNSHATVKHHAPESKSKSYEAAIGINNIKELLLNRKRFLLENFEFVYQGRDGGIERLPFDSDFTDLQLVVVCQQDGELLRFISLGYGIHNKIYLPNNQPSTTAKLLCLRSEQVEFDKQFYNISEKELIQLEELLGERIPWLMPSYQALGTAGYRNLQSKSQRH